MAPDPVFLIGTVLLLFIGVAALVAGFTAPRGRRALTSFGGALLLVSAAMSLTLSLAVAPIYETVSGLNGGRTAHIFLNVFGRASSFFWAVGLLLVALAATKRLPRPRVAPGPPGQYGHPGQYGQQGPYGAPQPGPHQGGRQYPGPRPPQQQGPPPSPGAAPQPPHGSGPQPPHGPAPR